LAGLVRYNRVRARAATADALLGDFVELEGVRLHFVSKGTGLPLILLHGNGSAAEDFDQAGIMESAGRCYRVIAFDRPGFGRSSSSRRQLWTPIAQADLIQAALRQIGIERYVVLGHSWGALVALQLALRHQPQVTGLVLVSGYYFPSQRLGPGSCQPSSFATIGRRVSRLVAAAGHAGDVAIGDEKDVRP
jgi:pimeloyl-ACP methyl ester carboxylesterase